MVYTTTDGPTMHGHEGLMMLRRLLMAKTTPAAITNGLVKPSIEKAERRQKKRFFAWKIKLGNSTGKTNRLKNAAIV